MICSFLALLLLVTLSQSSDDFCSEDLCDGSKHIACKNNGRFAPECPSDAVLIELTADLRDLAVQTQNDYRNQIALGKIKGYDRAARMATLVWNEQLAKFAEYNVRRCIFEHDKCRNTAAFKYAGQNLGQIENSKKHHTPKEIIETITKGWFDEYKQASMSYIQQYRNHDKKQMIGHFTQLVRDEAFAIGCAMAQFCKDGWYTTLYACDYTLTNILGLPIYEKSLKPASKCKSGKNSLYSGLCHPKEVYDNATFYET